MVTVVLDGYNVIHAVPELARELDHSLEAAREALVRLCRAYRDRRGDVERLYVVFDGDHAYARGPQADRGGVTVLFTRREEEADKRILSLLEAERGRSRFVVVSNDNEVFNNARAFGARLMSVRAFYETARPGSARRPEPPAIADKMTLSTRDAQRITEEYRKHLEGKTKSSASPRPAGTRRTDRKSKGRVS